MVITIVLQPQFLEEPANSDFSKWRSCFSVVDAVFSMEK
jgi:hypothetical protein